MMPLLYRPATIDEIYHLRFAVLRPGMTPQRVYFSGDDGVPPRTWHFGAFERSANEERNVACLTLFAASFEGRNAIQLRGMAVVPDMRSQGVGSHLVAVAEGMLRGDERVEGWPWWCNARAEAVAFYEGNGWRVVSEEFLVEGVGPHRKMVKGAIIP